MTRFHAHLLALGLAAAGSGCLTTQPPGAPARAEPAPFPGTASAPAVKHSTVYADGYRAGVVHHLDGGAAPTPAPPVRYQLANYWDAASPAGEEWTAGFRAGVAAARASGLRGPNEGTPVAAAMPAVARTVAPPVPPAAPSTQPSPSQPMFAAGGFRPVGQPIPPAAAEAKAPPPVVAPPKVITASAEVAAPPAKPAAERRPPAVTVERPKEPVAGEFAPWKAAQLPPPTVVREP